MRWARALDAGGVDEERAAEPIAWRHAWSTRACASTRAVACLVRRWQRRRNRVAGPHSVAAIVRRGVRRARARPPSTPLSARARRASRRHGRRGSESRSSGVGGSSGFLRTCVP